MVRASARVAKQDKEADEKNRSYFADVERKFKRTRSRHLESLESSNFGYQRSKAEEIIAQTGGGEQDGAAEVVGKKAKKTRTGRQQLATSKKPLGQILHETQELENLPSWIPTYWTIATAMPAEPARQLCAVCGCNAQYTCTRCGVRFCGGRCYGTHNETRCVKWQS